MSKQFGMTDGEMPAVLLVHGFNGEPLDMLELEQHLQAQGCATRNLLLPGHGTRARDLANTGWSDWSASVAGATTELLARYPRVVLVGHSMGAALSLHIAASDPRVAGVAALCPPLRMHPGEVGLVAITRLITPYVPTFREDVRDPDAQVRYARHAYRWTPLPAVHNLYSALPALRAELPRVRCPALVICARQDHVVPVRDGIEAFQLLGTADKELLVLEQSYHGVTKDVERTTVFDRVGAFAARIAASASDDERLGA
ncbi:MAG: alpha/beta fold hydrolase [Ktedonobacterales bacterium]